MSTTKRTRTPRGAAIPGPRRKVGRVEKGVGAALVAVRAGGKADPARAAIEAVVRVVARALDQAADDPYAVAQLIPRVLDVLTLAGLMPEPVGAADDGLGALLAAMSTPALLDT